MTETTWQQWAITITTFLPIAGAVVVLFVQNTDWIPVIGARYHVAIDGVSLPLYVLTYLLGMLCAIYTLRYVPSPGRSKAFVALTLLLITGMAGTFIAFD